MYEEPPSTALPDLVKLAGGSDKVAQLAMERAEAGRLIEALHLTDAALAADPKDRKALEARLKALKALRDRSHNSNERGWLSNGINTTQQKLTTTTEPRP
jgi:alkyl sulfatase BDS1-like metallo-beta-lactamase superfamily hydrolase